MIRAIHNHSPKVRKLPGSKQFVIHGLQIMQVNGHVFSSHVTQQAAFDLNSGRLRVVDLDDDGNPVVSPLIFPPDKEIDYWEFVCDTFQEAQAVVAHVRPLREKYNEEVAEAKRKLEASCYLIAEVIE